MKKSDGAKPAQLSAAQDGDRAELSSSRQRIAQLLGEGGMRVFAAIDKTRPDQAELHAIVNRFELPDENLPLREERVSEVRVRMAAGEYDRLEAAEGALGNPQLLQHAIKA
jgi:hypothetical protein